MVNRREFLGATLGAGATLTLTPGLLRALQQSGGKLIQRAIPSTGELVPVISFAPRPTAPRGIPGPIQAPPTDGPETKGSLTAFADKGGKALHVLDGEQDGEDAARVAESKRELPNKFYWPTPLSVAAATMPGYAGPPLKLDPGAVRAAMEDKFA